LRLEKRFFLDETVAGMVMQIPRAITCVLQGVCVHTMDFVSGHEQIN